LPNGFCAFAATIKNMNPTAKSNFFIINIFRFSYS
jgi:hypothetical protein